MPWSSQPARGDIAYIVYGDVTVDETAAIAPGVLLQADPGSRLVIAAGVSIGMGAILHANQGTLEIGAEAVIGASALIIGGGRIGDRACIGASSTLVHCSVAPNQVIAANTVLQGIEEGGLLADRRDDEDIEPDIQQNTEKNLERDTEKNTEGGTKGYTEGDRPPDTINAAPSSPPSPPPSLDTSQNQNGSAPSSSPASLPSRSHVYGFAQFEQLVTSLFPHRQALAPSPAPEDTPPESTA
ncbi:MAG TPA: hypothetical protein V6C88_14080 [Chroococcidiopsis sp.]